MATRSTLDAGVLELGGAKAFGPFIAAAKRHRVWDREPKLHGDDAPK